MESKRERKERIYDQRKKDKMYADVEEYARNKNWLQVWKSSSGIGREFQLFRYYDNKMYDVRRMDTTKPLASSNTRKFQTNRKLSGKGKASYKKKQKNIWSTSSYGVES